MTETDTGRYERYVSAGIERLNAHFGSTEWVERIDLAVLNQDSNIKCVLGQLFGDFGQGRRVLAICREIADTEGFALNDGGGAPDYRALTDVWKSRILHIKETRMTEITDSGIEEIRELLQISARLKQIGAETAAGEVINYVHDAIDRL